MDYPGRLYVAATLLPLASFVILLLAGALRAAVRPLRTSPLAASIYHALGGDTPHRTGAFIATTAIALAFVASLAGFVFFLQDFSLGHHPAAHSAPHTEAGGYQAASEGEHAAADPEARWSEKDRKSVV